MILFIDDEKGRASRWRESLEELDTVRMVLDAGEALEILTDPDAMSTIRLVVFDLAMHTTGRLTTQETGLGRLTGDALRKRLRATGWDGPVIVLTNARDDAVRRRVEADGDSFRRKSECLPSKLAALAAKLLSEGD